MQNESFNIGIKRSLEHAKYSFEGRLCLYDHIDGHKKTTYNFTSRRRHLLVKAGVFLVPVSVIVTRAIFLQKLTPISPT